MPGSSILISRKPRMRILLVNNQKKYRVGLRRLKALARDALSLLGLPEDLSLNINLVGKAGISRLNKKYFKKGFPTDVIALGYSAKERACRYRDLRYLYLGDIIICPDIAMENAGKYGEGLEREIALYVVHGILHLLGFSDTDAAKKKKMREKQKEILEKAWRKQKTKP
jgi:probable rRNA maturation factor